MTKITKRGKELRRALGMRSPVFSELERICSLIARHATTHTRLQELSCNRELTPNEIRRETLLEKRITNLVKELSNATGKSYFVKFGGDPRGYTVKLHTPDGKYNTWGGVDEGFGVG